MRRQLMGATGPATVTCRPRIKILTSREEPKCRVLAGLSFIFPAECDCNAQIPCYTAVSSRLPAPVRRSEPQEKVMSDHKSESGFQYSITNLKPVEPEHKITLTFPDGARREFSKDITGLEIAKGISPSLAKRTVAMALDDELADLNDPVERDARIEFVAREDARALELIRHDCAHVLAEAVQSLWPG